MRNPLRGLLGLLGILLIGSTPAAGQSYYQPPVDLPVQAAERDRRFAPQFMGAPGATAAAEPATSKSVASLLTTSRRDARPKALNGLYGSLVAVHVLDLVSTRAAMSRGAAETNPAMRGGLGQQIGIKAAMTLGSVVVAEKLWKKNKVAAIATLVATNSALALISAHNMRNARQLGR